MLHLVLLTFFFSLKEFQSFKDVYMGLESVLTLINRSTDS